VGGGRLHQDLQYLESSLCKPPMITISQVATLPRHLRRLVGPGRISQPLNTYWMTMQIPPRILHQQLSPPKHQQLLPHERISHEATHLAQMFHNQVHLLLGEVEAEREEEPQRSLLQRVAFIKRKWGETPVYFRRKQERKMIASQLLLQRMREKHQRRCEGGDGHCGVEVMQWEEGWVERQLLLGHLELHRRP
jgi:hypothetical protein